MGRLQKINAGFKALKTYCLNQLFTMSHAFLTGLKRTALTWKNMSHISISAPIRIEQHLNQKCDCGVVCSCESNLIKPHLHIPDEAE